ncbi:3-alpha,7-alpha,12-alpha-trihydroxy-5-beta-cholest-24-enoyl-CoA hydratase [Novosphingobium sp. ERN07]|uniref:MaoC/PaaZ C-terminal domain-containing protein n=1 Tax=Novosphingobium sp. ERN07 TaxID=2726187 RepID=UPI0014572775|nr:MaoC/PaaZ C-terminal domain-containing protein [Novosphingobium sp. ERN07]NLR73515.1 3-alpha,7-alpha,12-alpha-trihydroxy-5-beta-cholest-24-enoyl-CoA hydratase [Novosphingobium sp. ERN07]
MPVNAQAVIDRAFAPVTDAYGFERTILYALGVGAATDLAPSDMTLVYERGLKALPTMAVVLGNESFWMDDPETGITFAQVLHGEQGLEIHKPLPPSAKLIGQTSVEGLFDKGTKGAVLLLKRTLHDDAAGDLIATVRASVFLRADGGFGGSCKGQPLPYPIPDRKHDLSIALPTRPDQALIYRLSGDFNPLHVDAVLAHTAGFDRPILQGLCSYGIAGRAIIRALCNGDPERITRLDVRFSAPVYPGETLVTEIWREGPGRAAFRVRIAERNVVALNNGLVEYKI